MDINNKLAILTLDPSNGGGVLHSMLAYKSLLEKHFASTTIFFLSFSPELSSSIRRFKFSSSCARGKFSGVSFVSIGSRWAFYEPWHYSATIDSWARELESFDCFFVTSGTAISAHPLALLGKKYSLSFASDFDSDRAFLKQPNILRAAIASLAWPKMNKIEHQCIFNASTLLPMSTYAKDKASAILGGSFPNPCTTAGYPIFLNAPEVELVSKDPNLCVSIGRFKDRRKNVGLLLKAWERVVQDLPKAKLLLIGDPPEVSLLEAHKKLLVSGSVELITNASAKDKFFFLSKSSALIISSEQEGLGITGLEAALCRTPVVSTMCGGPEDYVVDGQTGFFVPRGDWLAMAQKIIQLLSLPEKAKLFGENLYELVAKDYATEKIESAIMQSLI